MPAGLVPAVERQLRLLPVAHGFVGDGQREPCLRPQSTGGVPRRGHLRDVEEVGFAATPGQFEPLP